MLKIADKLLARPGKPYILGHRGAMGHAPENTMAGFRLAEQMKCDAVELDVHLSADGHLMVIHDDTVDRTTNGTGRVEELTLAQLKKLDAGDGEPIPTLEEVLAWSKGRMPVVIEAKPTLKFKEVVSALVNLVDHMGVGEEVVFISFDHFIPREIKRARQKWLTGLLYVARVVDPVGLARSAGADGIMPNFHYLPPETVQQAHDGGLWVGTWTPSTEEELKQAFASGADLIGTNFPDRAKR